MAEPDNENTITKSADMEDGHDDSKISAAETAEEEAETEKEARGDDSSPTVAATMPSTSSGSETNSGAATETNEDTTTATASTRPSVEEATEKVNNNDSKPAAKRNKTTTTVRQEKRVKQQSQSVNVTTTTTTSRVKKYYAVRPRPELYFQKPVIFFCLEDLELALNAIPIQRHLGIKEKSFPIPKGHFEPFDNFVHALEYIQNNNNNNNNTGPTPKKKKAKTDNGNNQDKDGTTTTKTTTSRKRKRAIVDEQAKEEQDPPVNSRRIGEEKRFDLTFERNIQKLKAYKEEHGSLDYIPSNKEHRHLKRWIIQQRKYYKSSLQGQASLLKLKHVLALQDLGINITQDEEASAQAHHKKLTPEEKAEAKRKKAELALQQKAQKKQDAFNERFEERLQEFKAYKEEHGHVQVDFRTDLGRFLLRLRRLYNDLKEGNPSPLQADQIVALTDLGISMTSDKEKRAAKAKEGRQNRFDQRFQERLEEIKAYKEEHGDVNVPKESPLHKWICKTRGQCKRLVNDAPSGSGGLTMDHVNALRDVGVYVAPLRIPADTDNPELLQISFDRLFDKRVEQMKAFKAEHGNFDFPADTALRIWTRKQRQNYLDLQNGKPSLLQLKHIMVLKNVGLDIQSSKPIPTTEETVRLYIQFVKKHGRHPKHFGAADDLENRLSGAAQRWRHSMRLSREGVEKYRGRRPLSFSQEQLDALKEINFRWEYKIDVKTKLRQGPALPWDARLEHLKAYKEKHGHTEVPKRHPKLGRWVLRQRQEYKSWVVDKRSTMTMERFRKLSEIGFRFKQAGPGHSRTRYVDDSSSGYDTTDDEDSVDRRGRPREEKNADVSSDESESEHTDKKVGRGGRGGRSNNPATAERMQSLEWAIRNEASGGDGGNGPLRNINPSFRERMQPRDWSIRNALNF